MDLAGYIAKGIDLAGGEVVKLAEHLNVRREYLPRARAGTQGLPAYACVKLAQLIGEDPTRVIAASELVTETKEERRAVWLPFVVGTATNAQKKIARTADGFARARSFT